MEKVRKMVMDNRQIKIIVDDDVSILIGLCHEIVSNVLGIKRAAAKFVPKLLNFEQKQRRMKLLRSHQMKSTKKENY